MNDSIHRNATLNYCAAIAFFKLLNISLAVRWWTKKTAVDRSSQLGLARNFMCHVICKLVSATAETVPLISVNVDIFPCPG